MSGPSSGPLPPSLVPPALTTPPAPTPSESTSTTPSSSPAKNELKNPGEYEDIGKRVKESIFPHTFEGCKFVLQKGLSQHFQTSHTITIGSSTAPTQWQFGATYVGQKKIGDNDFRPVMLGELGTSGNFGGVFLHQFGNVKLRCNAQTQGSKWVGYQTTVDYAGSDYTASLTLANPDVISNSVVAVAQYLQAFTPKLSLGTELLFQRGGGMEVGLLSLGGMYKATGWEASGKLGMHAWNLSYLHSVPEVKDLTLVAECEGSLMNMETVAGVGYRYDLGEGSISFRGKIDSKWTISSCIEKRLDPLPAHLLLSAQLNHVTDEAKVGVGFTIG